MNNYQQEQKYYYQNIKHNEKIFFNVQFKDKNEAKVSPYNMKWDPEFKAWWSKNSDNGEWNITKILNSKKWEVMNIDEQPEIKPKCKECGRSLCAIGNDRKNGKKNSLDWDSRQYHKKCYKELLR